MSKKITRKQLGEFLNSKSKEWIIKEYIKVYNCLEKYKRANYLQSVRDEIEANLDWTKEDVIEHLKDYDLSKGEILKMFPYLKDYYDSKRKV